MNKKIIMKNTYVRNKKWKAVTKNIFYLLSGILMIGFLFSSQKSYATHAAGADLTYRWVSNSPSGHQSTYEVTGTFYRDCAGVVAPKNLTITATSVSCGFTGSNARSATIDSIRGTGLEITFPCTSTVTTCMNSGSTNPGFQKYVYRGLITLPERCSDWTFSYQVCCRNCAITTMSQPSPCSSVTVTTNIYVEAKLDNLNFSNNNSPTFNNFPVAFICLGQSFTYNHGVTDLDGDSLYYELIDAKASSSTIIPYINPFSGTNPLNSLPAVSINSSTGDITMTPQALQVGVVAIRVKEYRAGVLIGSVIRDMQFIVRSCGANNLPTASGINGTTKYSAMVCAGNSISFTINSNDIDAGQIVSMTWDNGISGATFTTAGSPHPTGTFTWNTTLANARSQPYQFTVTVRDDNCPTNGFQTYSYTIFVPLIKVTLIPSLHNGFNISCNGGSDGSLMASPSGGTPPYSYSWSTAPVQTTQTITGLTAGTYSVTVTDSLGCTNAATASIVLTEPPVLLASIASQTDVTCLGASTGSATATASGGAGGYSFSWNTAPVQTTAIATGLAAGTYIVTVTDTNVCTDTASVTITESASALNTVISSTNNVSCNGNNNGSIDLTVTGGVPPYTFLWSPGNITTEDLSGLDTGTYTVVVTDSLGCTSTASATIIQPVVIVPLITSVSAGGVNILCYGGNTGSATASATGGTMPYKFLWSPSNDTSATINGLSAGIISVLVTDANGCTGTAIDTLTQPDSLYTIMHDSVYNGVNISCHGLSNGAIDLEVHGGTAPYSFVWSNSATTEDISNLTAGTYSVTVTDTNGCTTSNSTTLTEPDTLDPVSISPTGTGGYNIACHGEASGVINTTVNGGTPPYSYLWLPTNDTIPNLIHLTAGTYFLTVTDANGCTDTTSVPLSQPDTIVPLLSSVSFSGGANITCAGNSDGTDTVSVSGGTMPYSYFWSTSDTTAIVTGLSAGPISVHIVDANGCSVDGYDTLFAPLPITADSMHVTTSCTGSANGSIDVFISGGTMPYSYQWSTSPADTLSGISGLSPGDYTVIITDAHNCVDSFTVTLTQPDTIKANEVITSFSGYQIRCNGDSSGAIDLSTSGGTPPYTYSWSNSAISEDLTNIPAGTYSVTVTDSNGCTGNFSYTLIEPNPIVVTDTSTNISCNGFFDGSIRLFASGGVPAYTFSWAFGGTSDSAFSLGAGTYAFTVTDSNNCAFTDSITLTQPLPITITDSALLYNTYYIRCYGGTSNCIQVFASGGTPGYTYTWGNELGTDTICNLVADRKSVV